MLKGKNGIIRFGDPGTAVAKIQNWSLDQETDEVTGWGMGDQFEDAFSTVTRWSGSFECYQIPGSTSDSLEIGTEYKMDLYPDSDAVGAQYFSGNVAITSISRSGAKDGIVMQSVNFRGNGTLTKAAVV